MRMLENEGFAWENYIDIFDGGPTMTVRTDQIRSLREASDAVIVLVDESLGDQKSGHKVLATSGKFAEFRAAYGWISTQDDGIAIDPNCATQLGVGVGDTITHVARW